MTLRQCVFSVFSIFVLTACGETVLDDPSQDAVSAETSNSSKRGISVSVVDARTTTQSGGFVDVCELDLELRNSTGRELRSVRVAFAATAAEGWQQATIDAAGEQSFYFSRPPKGKSSKTSAVRGATCEQITSVQIVSMACAFKNGDCPSSLIAIDPGEYLKIDPRE